jgi:osmotically-inducible protein OsmY
MFSPALIGSVPEPIARVSVRVPAEAFLATGPSMPAPANLDSEDAQILDDLRKALRQDKLHRGSAVFISVVAGAVTFWGPVASKEARRALEVAARAIPEVRSVQNLAAVIPFPTVSL